VALECDKIVPEQIGKDGIKWNKQNWTENVMFYEFDRLWENRPDIKSFDV